MGKIVYFIESEKKFSVIRFVCDYFPKRWFRKEKISYCDDVTFAMQLDDGENDMFERMKGCIRRDYTDAEIFSLDFEDFKKIHAEQMFWVIVHPVDNYCKDEYYCGNDKYNKAEYTTDMQEVRIMLSESSAKETLRTIQQTTRDRVYVRAIYLNLTNQLLTPIFMITCTSKRSQVTKYFAREDGKRLRLVTTSNAATKFSYEDVLAQFEHLKQTNKNFLYAVLPAFKDNVNVKNIESYMKENGISRMLIMDLQLKFMNRNVIFIKKSDL